MSQPITTMVAWCDVATGELGIKVKTLQYYSYRHQISGSPNEFKTFTTINT